MGTAAAIASSAANAFFARARAVVVVARRIRFKSPLCIHAIGSLAFRDLCKSERGIPRKKGERKKLTGLGVLRRWDDDDACTFFFDASSAVGGSKSLDRRRCV